MNANTTDAGSLPDALRERMVDRIVEGRPALDPRIREAMRTVPRHAFVPDAGVDEAYAEQAVITKRAGDGTALSCASGPGIVAGMLDQLDIRPSHNIQEIGAGTGYNAALLDVLTGPTGQVTTIDIDADVTTQARMALDTTGHDSVRVITRDGVLGDDDSAPYDRMIVTVGSWDIPAAWWRQLALGGRLVVPLRWRGQTRSVAFAFTDDRLVSDSVELCGFVPMVGQEGEFTGAVDSDDHVTLHWDADQNIDPNVLRGVLDLPKAASWSGTSVVADESFDGVWLRLTAVEPGTCRIAADSAAVDSGLCAPAIPARSPALVDGDSLAYFTLRRHDQDGTPRWELGAIGHGPGGRHLADRMCKHIRAWDHDRHAQPVVTAYPAGTGDDQLADGLVLDKRDSRIVLSY